MRDFQTMRRWVGWVATAVWAAGCASAPALIPPDPPEAASLPTESGPGPLDEAALREALEQAHRAYAAGTYAEALRFYDQARIDYASPGGAWEAALATNLALTSLEMGDREAFLRYAAEGQQAMAGLRFLTGPMQLVVALRRALEDASRPRDPRVPAAVYEAVATTLEGR